MKKAVLHLISGKEIEIKVSKDSSWGPRDFTRDFIHRFPSRTDKADIFVQGDRIDCLIVLKEDA